MMSALLILAAEAPVAGASFALNWAAIWEVVRNLITIVSVTTGVIFVLSGTIGVLRLPDFFTRLHAAGMTDTLGAELILLGLIVQADKINAVEPWQMIAKLLLVAFFLFITSPTATHAIAHAAYRAGEKPLLGRWRAPEVDE